MLFIFKDIEGEKASPARGSLGGSAWRVTWDLGGWKTAAGERQTRSGRESLDRQVYLVGYGGGKEKGKGKNSEEERWREVTSLGEGKRDLAQAGDLLP